jgi:hypothetical protein
MAPDEAAAAGSEAAAAPAAPPKLNAFLLRCVG